MKTNKIAVDRGLLERVHSCLCCTDDTGLSAEVAALLAAPGVGPFTFEDTARAIKNCNFASVGAWTDGIGVYADHMHPALIPGKRYRITIEEPPAPET